MSKIFVSYRREDTSGHSGRLYDRLCLRFGKKNIFRDIDHITYGEDFVETLQEAIGSCKALIAIIGPNWTNIKDKRGRRRLDNPYDFVRLEIESALLRGIPIFPVLVKNAEMPDHDELPQEISKIARFQAMEISETRIDYDVGKLVEVLETKLNISSKPVDATDEEYKGQSKGTAKKGSTDKHNNYKLPEEFEDELLPSSVKYRLAKMKVSSQLAFLDLFRQHKKSKINAYLLLIFPLPILGLHNLYLNNRNRQFVFWAVSAALTYFLLLILDRNVTLFSLIVLLVWPLIDFFLMPAMLDKCNEVIAQRILQEIETE